ncbi:MAG: hypothetical protein R6V03_09345 [Kiritimatiellia bacterium]
MDFLRPFAEASITLPVLELTGLLLLSGICLVFRWVRVGLMVAYLFAFKWAWPFYTRDSTQFMAAFLAFGGLVAVLAVIGLLQAAAGGGPD